MRLLDNKMDELKALSEESVSVSLVYECRNYSWSYCYHRLSDGTGKKSEGGEERDRGPAYFINNKWCHTDQIAVKEHFCSPDIELFVSILLPQRVFTCHLGCCLHPSLHYLVWHHPFCHCMTSLCCLLFLYYYSVGPWTVSDLFRCQAYTFCPHLFVIFIQWISWHSEGGTSSHEISHECFPVVNWTVFHTDSDRNLRLYSCPVNGWWTIAIQQSSWLTSLTLPYPHLLSWNLD